jgi:hypothetical protein
MSLHRRAARRDSNEAAIVAALVEAGASVTRLKGDSETMASVFEGPMRLHGGEPDLLVGYQGRTYHLEVKLPLGPRGGRRSGGSTRPSAGGDGTLTEDQIAWWAAWRGTPPVIVRTPEEALRAIREAPPDLAGRLAAIRALVIDGIVHDRYRTMSGRDALGMVADILATGAP